LALAVAVKRRNEAKRALAKVMVVKRALRRSVIAANRRRRIARVAAVRASRIR